MELCIYTSGFNLIQNGFDFRSALDKFIAFADEVVIAINTSDDDTLAQVLKYSEDKTDKLKIVLTAYSYDDPDLDGKIKNAALQATTKAIKIGLDLDEYIPLSQKHRWTKWIKLLNLSDHEALLIPSVNLYRDNRHYASIGFKWYVHKDGLYRGTVNFAKREDGTHDITRSDSCELIDENGNLANAYQILNGPTSDIDLEFAIRTGGLPYVIHTGYVDLPLRIHRNTNFWKRHWETEEGHPVDIPLTLAQLEKTCYLHNLPLL